MLRNERLKRERGEERARQERYDKAYADYARFACPHCGSPKGIPGHVKYDSGIQPCPMCNKQKNNP